MLTFIVAATAYFIGLLTSALICMARDADAAPDSELFRPYDEDNHDRTVERLRP